MRLKNEGNSIQLMPASAYPLGVFGDGDDLIVSARYRGTKNCGICLFSGSRREIVLFDASCRTGRLFSARLLHANKKFDSYLLYEDGKLFCDPYARKIIGLERFGEPVEEETLRCKSVLPPYDWRGDIRPQTSYADSFFYCLNVRGFSKGSPFAASVRRRGTFAGLADHIPYLKELGVTAVELMPVYEIQTAVTTKDAHPSAPYYADGRLQDETQGKGKSNLWGYQDGYYFAPRASYAADAKHPETECKDMIRAFHQAGIEVILQFYFAAGTSQNLMTDCIRYWVSEYHIDGIHLKSDNIPVDMIAQDPMLSDIKIMSAHVNAFPAEGKDHPLFLAEYSDSFIWTARRFLKGDDCSLRPFADAFTTQGNAYARIRYIANYDGFTLRDLVTYEHKRNDSNGEGGADGRYDNFSWNCGVEGESRKHAVLRLRSRQMRNALFFVMLSAGPPLLYAGDECGNTQSGNNNAYCQDNRTGWKDWPDTKNRYHALITLVRELAFLRRRFPVLRGLHPLPSQNASKEMKRFPDLSFHGAEAWRPDFSDSSHAFGVLYADASADAFLYVIFNMYWNPLRFLLPDIPAGYVFRRFADTAAVQDASGKDTVFFPEAEQTPAGKESIVSERSIQLFLAEKEK